ncbi:RNA polymerase sigma-70 factor [Dysgonomonas sp. 25]|uniref:RNA polymerase sigma-70 factor n=1 Tax=Dysgonomonas sp. 25 TaxID=2302933 RepID=UPI0013D6F7B5|nr:RNA polymerase sigma-70 factor [Dysgonomonas sp. 25]NDV69904.1 RNA polymerase sigma-70 factor [Dysgonomonas sp. 25]
MWPLKEKKTTIENEFEVFFLENYPRVKSFALHILMSEEDAEDISQDIFLKLLNYPKVWRDKDKDRRNRYMFKMTKNHIFNFIKHKNIERKYQQELIKKNLIIDELDLEDTLHAKEIELLITYTIEQMPQRRKEVFMMSRFDGKSNAQIADALDMSVRTVERHLYLALLELKKSLIFYRPVE